HSLKSSALPGHRCRCPRNVGTAQRHSSKPKKNGTPVRIVGPPTPNVPDNRQRTDWRGKKDRRMRLDHGRLIIGPQQGRDSPRKSPGLTEVASARQFNR
ncbi:hypothetical protein CEXT_252061, partial [Caerostris extrusa]